MRLNWVIPFIVIITLVVMSEFFVNKYASCKAAKVLGNTTYFIGNEHVAQAVTLVNGVHEEPYIEVRYDDRYVYGDFNHDGLKDAAGVFIENSGGNADWYTLAFFINDGKNFVHKASRELDDRAIINSVRESKGKVIVDMFIHQDGDCMAGPTKRVKDVYEYNGPDTWKLRTSIFRNNSFSGNGYGLCLVKKMVERNHGAIEVQSGTPFGATS